MGMQCTVEIPLKVWVFSKNHNRNILQCQNIKRVGLSCKRVYSAKEFKCSLSMYN